MKNLKFLPKYKPFCVHQAIVNKKRDVSLKATLQSLEQNLKSDFTFYDSCLKSNTLDKYKTQQIFYNNKDVLQKCYSYDQVDLRNYLKALLTSDNGIFYSECPICQIDSVSSFDHFMPQSLYPQLSDNTHNLIPCCSICNSSKGNSFLDENNERRFLNLYIDKLPDTQFLFINTTFTSKGRPICIFNVQNINSIEQKLFSRIHNTFTAKSQTKKNSKSIIDRLNEKIPREIDILKNEFQRYTQFDSGAAIEILRNRAMSNESSFGQNYWKSVFFFECANNQQLLQFLLL